MPLEKSATIFPGQQVAAYVQKDGEQLWILATVAKQEKDKYIIDDIAVEGDSTGPHGCGAEILQRCSRPYAALAFASSFPSSPPSPSPTHTHAPFPTGAIMENLQTSHDCSEESCGTSAVGTSATGARHSTCAEGAGWGCLREPPFGACVVATGAS